MQRLSLFWPRGGHHHHLRQVARGDGRVLFDRFLDKGQRALAPPAELVARLPQSRLRDAVGEGDQPVARNRVDFGEADPPVRPPFGDHALAVHLEVVAVAKMDEGRVVHLDDPGLAADLQVEDRKRRIADPAHLADRQRIHDDLRRQQHIHVGTDEFQRHRGGHAREQVRLDAAAQPVGEHRQVAVLVFQPLEAVIVPADILAVVAELAALHFDKYVVVRHGQRFPLISV